MRAWRQVVFAALAPLPVLRLRGAVARLVAVLAGALLAAFFAAALRAGAAFFVTVRLLVGVRDLLVRPAASAAAFFLRRAMSTAAPAPAATTAAVSTGLRLTALTASLPPFIAIVPPFFAAAIAAP